MDNSDNSELEALIQKVKKSENPGLIKQAYDSWKRIKELVQKSDECAHRIEDITKENQRIMKEIQNDYERSIEETISLLNFIKQNNINTNKNFRIDTPFPAPQDIDNPILSQETDTPGEPDITDIKPEPDELQPDNDLDDPLYIMND